MFVFSPPHQCIGFKENIQVIVFSSKSAQQHFQDALRKNQVVLDGDSCYYNQGASFLLRAVKVLKAPSDTNHGYSPVIRCGITGECTWEGIDQPSVKLAFYQCLKTLYKHLDDTEIIKILQVEPFKL